MLRQDRHLARPSAFGVDAWSGQDDLASIRRDADCLQVHGLANPQAVDPLQLRHLFNLFVNLGKSRDQALRVGTPFISW